MGRGRRTVRLGGATVQVPAEHAAPLDAAAQGGAIDSPATTWGSADLRLLLDSGPFADTLDRYQDQPGYGRSDETIAGRPGRLVWFERADGARVVAAHLPAGREPALTLVVEGTPAISRDLLLAIARSLTSA